MKFLFDHNLPPALAKALHELVKAEQHECHALRDRFAVDAPDVHWLTMLGTEEDWAVISGDVRISRNKHERAAWLEADVPIFFLKKGWQNQAYWNTSWRLVRWMPHILEQAARIRGGAGFWVPVNYPGRPKFEQVRLH